MLKDLPPAKEPIWLRMAVGREGNKMTAADDCFGGNCSDGDGDSGNSSFGDGGDGGDGGVDDFDTSAFSSVMPRLLLPALASRRLFFLLHLGFRKALFSSSSSAQGLLSNDVAETSSIVATVILCCKIRGTRCED